MTNSEKPFYDQDGRRWYFEQNVECVYRFEELLQQYDLVLPSGSNLESACLEIIRILEAAKGTIVLSATKDHRDTWRRVVGLTDFVRKILSVSDHPSFKQLIPHIELLLDPRAGLVQNMASAPADQSTRKLYELYMGIVTMRISDDVILDPPEGSVGNNPDVIFEYGGKRWGIACKVMVSKNEKTYRDRLEEGIDQIERADVDRGVVSLNMKNVTSHDVLLPLYSDTAHVETVDFSSVRAAVNRLKKENPFSDGRLREAWSGYNDMVSTFADKKAAPLCLEYQSSTVGVMGIYMLLRSFSCRPFAQKLDDEVLKLLNDLNDSLHDLNAASLPA